MYIYIYIFFIKKLSFGLNSLESFLRFTFNNRNE
jgi:hypothetical protein